MSFKDEIKNLLNHLYNRKEAEAGCIKICRMIEKQRGVKNTNDSYFSEKDIMLITYPDIIRKDGEKPLRTLHSFLCKHLKNCISTVHILPFFPFSSDDGFSVIDYKSVNPEYGDWNDINSIGSNFRLMFDLVLNHISSRSIWFRKYLAGEKGFEKIAIEVDPDLDLSMVTRPRSSPLLTQFTKYNGQNVHLWTTFSSDQIDLNYKSIDTLIKIVDVLLYYSQRGASLIRLDAIAYLWKEIGTECIHLPQTHIIVRLLRKIFNEVRREGIIVTETNVPHRENITYFGNGHDEAQMIYNFTLPPLLLYTFISEDTTIINEWTSALKTPSEQTTFLNFTASHDGIGIRPIEGIVSEQKIEEMIKKTEENGGTVSVRSNRNGSTLPYELNITYIDALSKGTGNDDLLANRFLASQAIQLALPGVPAVYINSLLGSRNWTEGVKKCGKPRAINRKKHMLNDLMKLLNDRYSFCSQVFYKYRRLLMIRRSQKVFHPNGNFEIMRIDPKIFAIRREYEGEEILSLTNVSSKPVDLRLNRMTGRGNLKNLITDQPVRSNQIIVNPYEILWLKEQ